MQQQGNHEYPFLYQRQTCYQVQPNQATFFFFSSRRRHTRFDCDWSSDVCCSDLGDDREAEITAALGRAAAGARTLPLALAGFGVFPDLRRPRVVWAGMAPEPGLEILQHRVEQEFAPLGFSTEARPFRPHVTLGRARRDAHPRDFAGLEPALARLQVAQTAVVSGLDLMQSTLGSGGAVDNVRDSERLP